MLTCTQKADGDAEQLEMDMDFRSAGPEAADQQRIEELIAQHLTDGLQLIPEATMASALNDFVEKVSHLPH